MTKYKIKIITFGNDRKTYSPYVKTNWGWKQLDYQGKTWANIDRGFQMSSREDALHAIDLHFHGNTRVHSIEFEYINK